MYTIINTGIWNNTNILYQETLPLFVDFAHGDFRLTQDSQARDVGKNTYISTVSTDLDGNPRIAYTTVDIGAYEFQGVALTGITITPTDPKIGTQITTLNSSGATATYQWYRGTSVDDISTVITDATASSYTVTESDHGYYLKVIATGSGNYFDTVSANTTTIAKQTISTIVLSTQAPLVGTTITTTLDPVDSTVTYQWYRGASVDDISTVITDAISSSYTVTQADRGYYLKVVATGSDSYCEAVSANTTVTTQQTLESIALSTNTPIAGTTITTTLVPGACTATYQWYRGTSPSNISKIITGAMSSSYTPTSSDLGYYLKVVATGTGDFIDTVSEKTSSSVKFSDAPGTNISVVMTDTVAPSDTADSLPSSVEFVRKYQTVYAEIWVKNIDSSEQGIIGGRIDLNFNSAILQADTMNHGSIYNDSFVSGTIDNTTGLVNDFGGTKAPSEEANTSGVTQWVRLGYIELVATTTGQGTIELVPSIYHFARYASGNIDQDQVDLKSVSFYVSEVPDANVSLVNMQVQEDCSIYLDTASAIGNDLTYWWDLSGTGTGEFELKDSSFWVSASMYPVGEHILRVKVVNAYGVESEPVSIKLTVSETLPALEITKTVLGESDQLIKLNMIVSYPDKRNVNQWLIDWGDGTTSSAQVLSRSYSMAHYYQQSDVTQGYLITATFTDTDGSETTMAIATHTVAGKQEAAMVPEYIAIDPVEEVEVEKIDIPKTAAQNDSSITQTIRTDLDGAALHQLKYWNTKPTDLAVRSNIANRFRSALSNGFSFALPTETLTIVPNENPDLWSKSFVEDLEDDFDFINDQTIARYTNESTDSIILDMEEEMGEVEFDLRIWGE